MGYYCIHGRIENRCVHCIDQKDIDELEQENEKLRECINGLMVEVYCLYQQSTNTRLDRTEDTDGIVYKKYNKAKQLLNKGG